MRERLTRSGLGHIHSWLMPLFVTLLVLLVGAVISLLLGVNPLESYGALVVEALGSTNPLADTGVRALPSLTGLGVSALSTRGDLFFDGAKYDVDDSPTWVVSCLGDSITNGYPYAGMENTYPARLLVLLQAAYGLGGFDVINHGVDGYRADQVLADLQDLNWMAEDPHFVLLMVGGNDLAQEVLPDLSNLFQVINQTVSEVQAIVDLVTAHANADGFHPQIIVSAFPPNLILGVGGSVVVALYNSSLEDNLTGMDLWITDNWDDLYDPDTGQAKESLMYDTVHPNADGYAVIAENWFEAINSLLPTPTPTPTSTPTPSLTPTTTSPPPPPPPPTATPTPSPTTTPEATPTPTPTLTPTPDNYDLYLPLSWKNH